MQIHAPSNYTGPKDGLSHPTSHPKLLRAAAKAVLSAVYRPRIQGADKLPLEGPQVYCFNHPTITDPLTVFNALPRDVRYPAAIETFLSVGGPLMEAGGAFPINRRHPAPSTLKHAVNILKQGLGIGIAPEGGCSDDPLKVNAFRRGPAWMAVNGHAENLVPLTLYYHPDDTPRTAEKVKGWLTAAAVTAGGVLATTVGGPVVAAVVGTTGAALAGGYLAGKLVGRFVHVTEAWDPAGPPLIAHAAGAAAGVVLAAAGTAAALAMLPATAAVVATAGAVAGGLGILGVAHEWSTRDIADVVVGDPIPVQPFVDQYGTRQATFELTRTLHTVMGKTKEALTGVPFDPNAPLLCDPKKPAPGWDG